MYSLFLELIKKRKLLHKLVNKYGLSDSKVLDTSREIDEIVIKIQRVMAETQVK